jgi:hypothetical protein
MGYPGRSLVLKLQSRMGILWRYRPSGLAGAGRWQWMLGGGLIHGDVAPSLAFPFDLDDTRAPHAC